MAAIQVAYTAGCVRCGTVNIKAQKEVEQEQFEQLSQKDPTSYWKEDKPDGVLYRQHEESSRANCRTSC
jgi:hypothetical protein